ncbi:MAG: hypothetical protein JWN70_6926 [Planctomycetaceae bacterium]|nr:hypothetical protein [Planctomycetaceae bacterium]
MANGYDGFVFPAEDPGANKTEILTQLTPSISITRQFSMTET